MNSIGSAHADRFYARESAPVSTPDRILFIIGTPQVLAVWTPDRLKLAHTAGPALPLKST